MTDTLINLCFIYSVSTTDYSNNSTGFNPIINTGNSFSGLARSISSSGETTTITIYWSAFSDNGTTNDGLCFTGNPNFLLNVASLIILQFGSVPISRGGYQFNGFTGQNAATDTPTIISNTNFNGIFANSSTSSANFGNIGTWNTSNVNSMGGAFQNCQFFNQDISSWDVSHVQNMNSLFMTASAFNQNIGSWNTVACTDMTNMFSSARMFNQNIGSWNTGACTNMANMFYCANVFNQNLNSWNTSKVVDMSNMFMSNGGTMNFNGNISAWNTGACTNMINMFVGCTTLNQNLNTWNTSKVVNMSQMFQGCTAFNQPLNSWNTGLCTNMASMFNGCSAFNQSLNSWDVSKVQNMGGMFRACTIFNQPLNSWNTGACTSMSLLFTNCTNFNQPLNSWDMSKVLYIDNLFANCTFFNQNLNSWNTLKVVNMNGTFANCSNFNGNINSWDTSACTNMSSLFLNCTQFNQPLNTWNTIKVSTMNAMFSRCSAFNQTDIGYWNLTACTNILNMLTSTGYTTVQFTQFLVILNINNTLKLNLTLGTTNLTYFSNIQLGNLSTMNLSSSATANLQIFSNTCFPENTPVNTDQGIIAIDKIDPSMNTIRKQKIVAITKTICQDKTLVKIEKNAFAPNVPSMDTVISNNHQILYKGKLIRAIEFLGFSDKIKQIKYCGEVLYNVLLEEHSKMVINNLIVETLHPEHRLAKMYSMYHFDKLDIMQQLYIAEELNKIAISQKQVKSK